MKNGVSRNCHKMAAERGRAPVMTARVTAEWRFLSWKSEGEWRGRNVSLLHQENLLMFAVGV